MFATRGFEATRIVDIARAAGVSHGTVGLYYATKEALLRACMDRMAAPKRAAAEALVAEDQGTAAEQLEALGRFWIEHLGSPEMQRLMAMTDQALRTLPEFAVDFANWIVNPCFEMFRTIIRRGIASGEFACDDLDTYANLLFGGLGHFAEWNFGTGRLLGHPIDAEAYLNAWVRAALGGLARAPAEPSSG